MVLFYVNPLSIETNYVQEVGGKLLGRALAYGAILQSELKLKVCFY